MIIWGSKGRNIEKDRGDFHCPQCDEVQEYKQMRVATYFTLYFIPLFETQHHGDYVECLNCSGQFKLEILDYKPPTQAERIVGMISDDLESGTPLQMAQNKLINKGLEPAIAEKLVAAAAGNLLRTCSICNLSFVPSIDRCSGCGDHLEDEQDYQRNIER